MSKHCTTTLSGYLPLQDTIILLALLEGFDSSLHVHTLYMWNLFTEEIFNHLSSWNMSFYTFYM